MRFCKDCKYFKPNELGLDFCTNPRFTEVDMITGDPDYRKAWALRKFGPCWPRADGFTSPGLKEIKLPWYKRWM